MSRKVAPATGRAYGLGGPGLGRRSRHHLPPAPACGRAAPTTGAAGVDAGRGLGRGASRLCWRIGGRGRPHEPRRHDHHRAGRSRVRDGSDLGHDRRGSSCGVDGRRSRLDRVRGHPCQPQRYPVRSARADPAGRAAALWRVRSCQPAGLAVRYDHGSRYVAHDFRKEPAFLGVQSSPAFVRAPAGNGCAERFVRTLKENLLWLQRFETIGLRPRWWYRRPPRH